MIVKMARGIRQDLAFDTGASADSEPLAVAMDLPAQRKQHYDQADVNPWRTRS